MYPVDINLKFQVLHVDALVKQLTIHVLNTPPSNDSNYQVLHHVSNGSKSIEELLKDFFEEKLETFDRVDRGEWFQKAKQLDPSIFPLLGLLAEDTIYDSDTGGIFLENKKTNIILNKRNK